MVAESEGGMSETGTDLPINPILAACERYRDEGRGIMKDWHSSKEELGRAFTRPESPVYRLELLARVAKERGKTQIWVSAADFVHIAKHYRP